MRQDDSTSWLLENSPVHIDEPWIALQFTCMNKKLYRNGIQFMRVNYQPWFERIIVRLREH